MVPVTEYDHSKVKKDELSALERSKLLSQGKEVDRLPCCLDGGETMAPMMGFSIKDYYFSSEMMAKQEIYMYRTFGTDGVGLSNTLRGMAEAMGAEIRYSDDNIAQLAKPALTLKNIDEAKLIDVDKDGRFHIILEGLKILQAELGQECPISATVTGPFTIAAMVLGTEHLLMGMLKKPDKIHQLLDVIVENNRRYIDRLLGLGVGIGFADPVSTTMIISADQYRQFSLPYFQKNVDYIKSHGGGCGLHICGTSRGIWEDIATTGIGCFGPDNVEDMAEAKRVLGPHMGIQGNVPPVDVMKNGTPMDVINAAFDSMERAWDSPKGFTLTSGCQMPVGTPQENMHALMDAARIFSQQLKAEGKF